MKKLAVTILALFALAALSVELQAQGASDTNLSGRSGFYVQTSAFKTTEFDLDWVVDSSQIAVFHSWGVDTVTGTDHFEGGYGLALEGGYQFANNIRAGLEYTYTEIDSGFFTDSQGHRGRFHAQQLYNIMYANAYYDFAIGDRWNVFGGAGLGFGWSDHNVDNGTDYTKGNYDLWSWQVKVGISLMILENLDAFLNYRLCWIEGGVHTITFPYENFPYIEGRNYTTLTVDDAYSNNFEIGVRMLF